LAWFNGLWNCGEKISLKIKLNCSWNNNIEPTINLKSVCDLWSFCGHYVIGFMLSYKPGPIFLVYMEGVLLNIFFLIYLLIYLLTYLFQIKHSNYI
jgi:hypothetical protein